MYVQRLLYTTTALVVMPRYGLLGFSIYSLQPFSGHSSLIAYHFKCQIKRKVCYTCIRLKLIHIFEKYHTAGNVYE